MNAVATFEKISFSEFYNSLVKLTDITEEQCKELYDNIKLPCRSTAGSAGYDFFSPISIDEIDNKEESITIPTGIRCRIDEGYYLGLFPRSSLGFKYGMRLNNTTGIIDSDYYFADNEGHIMAKFKFDKPHRIEAGEKFMQGIFIPFYITTNDEATAKRTGGFGSTGK